MRCSKCGEEYKENQAFCLKCGNPIHVVPDFNLIEAELANDVGALMADDENPEKKTSALDDYEPMKTVNVPVEDISLGLKMVDIRREKFSFEDEMDEDEANLQRRAERPKKQHRPTKAEIERKKRAKRIATIKNIAIIFSGVIVLALLVVALIQITQCSGLNESSKFVEQYNIAKGYYEDGDQEKSIDSTLKAIDVAKSSAEVLKGRILLHDVYEYFGVQDEEYLENLLKIVEIGTSDTRYSEAILNYYYSCAEYDKFNSYLEVLEKSVLTDEMKKYLPSAPTANYGDDKHYNEFIKVELTADEDCVIYYTMDGSDPKTADSVFEYVEPISLESEGTYDIKAYAQDVNGIRSEVLKVKYVIESVEMSGPSVTPASGAFEEYEMIEVTVPEGCEVYYTVALGEEEIEDVSELPSSAVKYEEPIELPYGYSSFQFVAVDGEGNLSSVTYRTYRLTVEYVVEGIESAETLVMDKCIQDKALDENACDVNGTEYSFKFVEMSVIDNKMCYVIKVTATVAEGAVDATAPADEYYSVNVNTSEIYPLTVTDEGYVTVGNEEAE